MPATPPVTSVDDYIGRQPTPVRPLLEQARQAIHQAAPDVIETISYGIPTFDLHGQHLVFVAAWKRHLAMYPFPAGDDAFQEQIAPYKRVKSSLHFPLDQPLPVDLIITLVGFLQRERFGASQMG